MTFTQEIKREALRLKTENSCCRKAMLYGMLLCSAWFEEGRVCLSSENREICERAVRCLEELIGKNSTEFASNVPEDTDGEPTGEGKGRFREYRVRVTDKALIRKLLDCFGCEAGSSYRILYENFRCDACRAAFLRGAFLVCGNCLAPSKGYHLEFVVPRFGLSRELLRLLKLCGFEAKYTKRNSHYVLYFKDSEAIVDLIALVGAVNCSFRMTNSIIEKDIRNNCNRVANCETANIRRVITTASRQIDAIEGLQKAGRFSLLPTELRTTALLRQENPDLPLAELAVLHTPPVTKSCVDHRLTKLLRLWEHQNGSSKTNHDAI